MDKQLDFISELMPARDFERAKPAVLQINVEMLTLAREAHGYTQKELANKLGCNQSRLSKIEAGELLPQESDIQNLVGALGLNRNFYFQQGTSIPANVSFYRKTQTLPLKMLRQCNAQMNVLRLQIEHQIGGRKLGKRELPYLPPEENQGAVAVAKQLRREWKLNPGPVESLTELVEDAGCVIVDYSFPTVKLDGLCVRAPEKAPIVFLNKDLPK